MATALRLTQPATSCTDHELIAAVRSGSDSAFEELYTRYRGRIGSYVFGMVGDHARAEDIAQEVFISALRRLRDTERPIAFKPWLYEIAKNASIDEFRRTRRAREVPLEHDDDADGASLQLVGAPAADAAVESRQQFADLRGAFRGLSESHHRVIVMRELEGLSYEQIGTQLGMSKAMVESTLFRARKRLGEEYDELVSGRRCERIQAVIAAGEERPLRSLGVRDRRQLARHLAHCQPCRRSARLAGVDESFFQTPGLAGKIAALLPIPWLRWRRSHDAGDAAGATGTHQLLALQSLQGIAQFADPSGPSYGLGRAAAAAAAALVIAGAGGGIVSGLGGDGTRDHARPAAPRQHHAAHAVVGRAASARVAPARAATRRLSAGGGGGSAGSSSHAGGTGGGSTAGGVSATGASSRLPAGSVASGASKAAGSTLQSAQGAVGAVSTGKLPSLGSVTGTANQLINGVTGQSSPQLPNVSLPGLPSDPLPQPQLPPLPKPQLPPLPQPSLPPLPQPQLPPLPKPQLPSASSVPVPKLPLPNVQLPKLP